MGMKQRRCDRCGKRRRFDADSWGLEGWIQVGTDADGRPIRWCPWCAKRAEQQGVTP